MRSLLVSLSRLAAVFPEILPTRSRAGFNSPHSGTLVKPAHVVWGTWLLMVVALVVYQARFAHNVPFYDEWTLIGVLDGTQPVDATWLWAQHNDHRIPLPKLILVGLLNLSGWDFRIGMVFNLLALALVSALMIITAARLRGELSVTDAFFPLLLLHWGHYENLLWNWQATQVIPVVIVLCLLSAIARWDLRLGPGQSAAAGVGVLALPLCGVPGLAYVPGFVIWLVVAGFAGWRRRTTEGRQSAFILAGCGGMAILLIVLYFIDFRSSVSTQLDIIRSSATAVAFAGQSLGPTAVNLRMVVYPLVLLIIIATFVLLVRSLSRDNPPARARALAFLFFALAFAGVAAAVGVARPGLEFPNRYQLMATPALAAIYLVWKTLAPRGLAVFATSGLSLLTVASQGMNYVAGLEYGRMRDRELRAFETDLRQGMPPSELLARHQHALLPFPESGGLYAHEWQVPRFLTLQTHDIGAFRHLAPERRYVEIPLDDVADREPESTYDAGQGWTFEDWTFREELFVNGVRIEPVATLGSDDTTSVPTFIYWRTDTEEDFTAEERFMPSFLPETFWVYGEIRQLRIYLPSAPGLRAPSITLLQAE